jgi:peptide/nickel transport system substrate-binding protein
VRTTKRGAQVAALAVGLALIAAACGSDKAKTSDTTATTVAAATTTAAGTTPGTEAGTTPASSPASTPDTASADTTPGTGSTGTGKVAMTITYDINPDAVWDDGSPITEADFNCTYQADLNTPGSIGTVGYDQIIAVAPGTSDKQVVVTLKTVYAPYRGLFFGLIKKAAVKNCNDISQDFATSLPFSARPLKIDSWSPDQEILVPNDKYWGTDKAKVKQVILVPKVDTEIQALKAGEVDFIYPQFVAGIQDQLADPKVKTVLSYGGDYEAIYFNAKEGRPFADPKLREAVYKSIDLTALFKQIYVPIAADRSLLTCGPIVPGDFCPKGIFGDKHDQAGADAIMTADGYTKNGDGLWAKDGKVPDIKWMVNAGNTRRENSQAYLIPLLTKAGFKVTADNCDAACVFQKRQPTGDYDMAMYISTAPPDPQYLVPSFASDQIPTDANGNTGQNFQWWDNATATKDLHASDHEVDATKRAALIKDAITQMDKDYILIPLFQFPKSGAYRTDRVAGNEANLNNYMAFKDLGDWTDLDGNGKIVVGAEQWPECLNPVTNCANSSWYVWTVAFQVLPNVYDTTNDAKYAVTNLVTGEPKVVIAS